MQVLSDKQRSWALCAIEYENGRGLLSAKAYTVLGLLNLLPTRSKLYKKQLYLSLYSVMISALSTLETNTAQRHIDCTPKSD